MELIRVNDQAVVPWRNGGGVTREIAVWHDPAVHADFLWRVSIATVSAPGPFSSLPGIDRTLAVLDGEGLLLKIGHDQVSLGRDTAPFSFAGETPVEGCNIASDTTDLNVMSRRGHFSHRMRRIWIDGARVIVGESSQTIIVFNCDLTIAGPGGAETVAPGDTIVALQQGEGLHILPGEIGHIYLIEISADTGPSSLRGRIAV